MAKLRVKFNSTPYQSPRGFADHVLGFATAEATQAKFRDLSVASRSIILRSRKAEANN